jgi:hypothetical protein
MALAKMVNETEKEAEVAPETAAEVAPAAEGAAAEVAPAAALAQMRMRDVDPTKIESVRGPSNGAPIGYGVHKLAIEGGNPYAAKQMYRAEEPIPGVQHQPVSGPKPVKAPEAPVAAPLSSM